MLPFVVLNIALFEYHCSALSFYTESAAVTVLPWAVILFLSCIRLRFFKIIVSCLGPGHVTMASWDINLRNDADDLSHNPYLSSCFSL